MTPDTVRVDVGGDVGAVSGTWVLPTGARALFVLAHGAGAGMDHPFLRAVSDGLSGLGVGTFRYQFPYMDRGRRRPDRPPTLTATVRAAVRAARDRAGRLPIVAGGKSMGGRMTSMAAADEPGLEGIAGITFLGFPLHPAGRPSDDRAEHLQRVPKPMLFVQGTRDALADLELLRPVCARLGGRAQLHVVDEADHSFRVLKRSGRTDDEVMDELVRVTAEWILARAASTG